MKQKQVDHDVESYVTVMDQKSGEVMTIDNASAKRDIAYGRVIETIPSDPRQAKVWLTELRARVIDEMHAKGARDASARLGMKTTSMDVFRDYEDWCRENSVHALPVQDTSNVVRYLLKRSADGAIEGHHVNVYADIISAFHACTRHPTMRAGRIIRGTVSADVRTAFNRAMAFGRRRLVEETRRAGQSCADAAARALQMFPDGAIPEHWHHVAA